MSVSIFWVLLAFALGVLCGLSTPTGWDGGYVPKEDTLDKKETTKAGKPE